MGDKSLRKALDVVRLVSLQGEMSIRDIGSALGLPKSTAHRLVSSLVDVRLLESHRKTEGDVFAVGPLVGELSGGGLFWRPIVQYARPHLTALRDETGETVGVHVFYARRRVLLDQVVSHHQHRWVYNNQMVPMPLYGGAAAKMLLALLPYEFRRSLAEEAMPVGRRRSHGMLGLEDLLSNLEEIQRQRYSISSEEVNPGINAIAVPVIDQPVATLPLTVLSMAAPSVRLPSTVMKRYVKRMRLAAARVGAQLKAHYGGGLGT